MSECNNCYYKENEYCKFEYSQGANGECQNYTDKEFVWQIRAEAIDECIKMTTDERLCQIFEQLKEQN